MIAPELTDGIVEQARRFHALPMAEKLKVATARGQGSGFTGYLPSGEYRSRPPRSTTTTSPI